VRPLYRAARPAAVGTPIVQASPEQRSASCPAVRPSAASAPLRMRAQEFVASAKRSKFFSAQSNVRSSPRPCEHAAPALLRSGAAAGIGRAAHAGGGIGSIRRVQMPQAFRSRNHRAVCEQNTVTANPSIERTSKRLRLFAAAHLQRYASAAVRCFSNVGLFGGLRARSEVPRALRMSSALSVPARFAPQLARSAAPFAHAGACSNMQATQTPRRECVLRERSLACTQRRGSGAALRCLHRPVFARTQRRSAMAAQRWACASSRGFTRSQNALRCASSRPFASRCAGASRLSGVSGPGSHNPSIERTTNGGRACAVWRAVRGPLFAAHVER
jgi:hypothetical protein